MTDILHTPRIDAQICMASVTMIYKREFREFQEASNKDVFQSVKQSAF